MKRNFDELYEIFEDYLFEHLLEDENEDIFVANVVEIYMQSIKKQYSVMPQVFIEDIMEDTADLVYDMLLKKIYGYYNLRHFRDCLRTKSII